MNKEQIIIHIPHSSLKVPKLFKKRLLLFWDEFEPENASNADIYADKLVKDINLNKIIFKYSRMFCDVERFEENEPMAKKGMGIVYTKTLDQKDLINIDYKYERWVINKYYKPHHNLLNKETDKILTKYNKAYIFDIHSFSDENVYKLFGYDNLPDICIGVDKEFEDKDLTLKTMNYFKEKGYKVEVNHPYRGTMIPSKYYFNKDNRVKGMMIEINKRLYLNNAESFNKLKKELEEYFDLL